MNVSKLKLNNGLLNELTERLPPDSKTGWPFLFSKIIEEKTKLPIPVKDIIVQFRSIRTYVIGKIELTDDNIRCIMNIFITSELVYINEEKDFLKRIPNILRKKPFYKSANGNLFLIPIKDSNGILTGIELFITEVELSEVAYSECRNKIFYLSNQKELDTDSPISSPLGSDLIHASQTNANVIPVIFKVDVVAPDVPQEKEPSFNELMDAYLSISLKDYSLHHGMKKGVPTMKVSGKITTYFIYLPLLKDKNDLKNIERWFLDRINKFDKFARIKEVIEPDSALGRIKIKKIEASGKPEKFIEELKEKDIELFERVIAKVIAQKNKPKLK